MPIWILMTRGRYKVFEKQGQCPGKRCMWTMLHIKYCDSHPDRMVVYSRLPDRQTLAANYQENGLHYAGGAMGPDAQVAPLDGWPSAIGAFAAAPTVLGLDGKIDARYSHAASVR
jgi:hypothetical protein